MLSVILVLPTSYAAVSILWRLFCLDFSSQWRDQFSFPPQRNDFEVMMFDQLSVIFDNTTYIDKLKGVKRHQQRNMFDSLVFTFGNFGISWLLPISTSSLGNSHFPENLWIFFTAYYFPLTMKSSFLEFNFSHKQIEWRKLTQSAFSYFSNQGITLQMPPSSKNSPKTRQVI